MTTIAETPAPNEHFTPLQVAAINAANRLWSAVHVHYAPQFSSATTTFVHENVEYTLFATGAPEETIEIDGVMVVRSTPDVPWTLRLSAAHGAQEMTVRVGHGGIHFLVDVGEMAARLAAQA